MCPRGRVVVVVSAHPMMSMSIAANAVLAPVNVPISADQTTTFIVDVLLPKFQHLTNVSTIVFALIMFFVFLDGFDKFLKKFFFQIVLFSIDFLSIQLCHHTPACGAPAP